VREELKERLRNTEISDDTIKVEKVPVVVRVGDLVAHSGAVAQSLDADRPEIKSDISNTNQNK
jgi:hypothetical protein